jgi:hypothetical protein
MSRDKPDVCKQTSPDMYEANTEYIYSTHREMYYPCILIQQSPIKEGVHTNIVYILLAEKQRVLSL